MHITAGSVAASPPFTSLLAAAEQARGAVLRDDSNGTPERRRAERTVVERALLGMRAQFLSGSALIAQLTSSALDLLLHPYSSHSLAVCSPAILMFLRNGGAFGNIGGTPIVGSVDAHGVKRSAPVVQIDHQRGAFGGGRWMRFTAVREGSEDMSIRLSHRGTIDRHSRTIPAQQTALQILHRTTGALIGRSDA